jgi:hypothetical protein
MLAAFENGWGGWRKTSGRAKSALPDRLKSSAYFLTAGSTFGSSAFTAGAAAGVTAGIGVVATSGVAVAVVFSVMLESFLLATIGAAVLHIRSNAPITSD